MKTTKTFMMAFTSLLKKTFAGHSHMMLACSLPMNIRTTVMREFPGRSIAFATRDNGCMVELNDGTMLFFNKEGAWREVDHLQAPLSSLCVC